MLLFVYNNVVILAGGGDGLRHVASHTTSSGVVDVGEFADADACEDRAG